MQISQKLALRRDISSLFSYAWESHKEKKEEALVGFYRLKLSIPTLKQGQQERQLVSFSMRVVKMCYMCL